MTTEWYYEHYENGVDPAFFDGERRALSLAFDHYDPFGFSGLLIRPAAGGGLFHGAPLNQTIFDVNFEKAFSSVQGAYAIINREFSRMIHEKYPSVQFLNREDDMGAEGLRKAKLSYHPTEILEKFTALLPENAQ